MDIKNEDAPPPYSPEQPSDQHHHAASSSSLSHFHPSYLTSHLSSHLSALPSRIQASQQARSSAQVASDASLLGLIVPHVEAFLLDLGGLPRPPAVAILTIIPAAAVPRGATMSETDEYRQRGAFLRTARVEEEIPLDSKSKEAGRDTKSASANWGGGLETDFDSPSSWDRSREFNGRDRWESDGPGAFGGGSETDRRRWWWNDEAMARRLASHLQPRGPQASERNLERQRVQAVVEEREVAPPPKAEKKWGWSLRKNNNSSSNSSSNSNSKGEAAPSSVPDAVPETVAAPDQATMSVAAREVSFRRENDFGILESLGGFALVVEVRLR